MDELNIKIIEKCDCLLKFLCIKTLSKKKQNIVSLNYYKSKFAYYNLSVAGSILKKLKDKTLVIHHHVLDVTNDMLQYLRIRQCFFSVQSFLVSTSYNILILSFFIYRLYSFFHLVEDLPLLLPGGVHSKFFFGHRQLDAVIWISSNILSLVDQYSANLCFIYA